MSYTLEQKREARANGELWWRFANASYGPDQQWTNEQNAAISAKGAEYFIGPTPPRVLSELERELLEACKAINILDPQESSTGDWNEAFKLVSAAIKKAEAT